MVKALDLKSNVNFPRTIETCPQRSIFFFRNILGRSWEHEPILVFASNWDWRTKDSQLVLLERTCRRQRLETTITKTLSKKSNISASKNLSEDGIGFHQNKINVKIAMITQWLRRWTRNPMGTSRARSSPARSLRSQFQQNILKKLGTRTNTCVRKQLRLTNQRLPITFPERSCRPQRLAMTSTTILSKKANNNASKN